MFKVQGSMCWFQVSNMLNEYKKKKKKNKKKPLLRRAACCVGYCPKTNLAGRGPAAWLSASLLSYSQTLPPYPRSPNASAGRIGPCPARRMRVTVSRDRIFGSFFTGIVSRAGGRRPGAAHGEHIRQKQVLLDRLAASPRPPGRRCPPRSSTRDRSAGGSVRSRRAGPPCARAR